ncbi:hypothetical protein [Fangia hongkongensis]|uniref:hypothetical protein n=2 Tax=Fangia hongkongensis TaxID=270495 RepID=UPI00035C6C28|nr:hypothetical protein [Fangia hongkongensis]
MYELHIYLTSKKDILSPCKVIENSPTTAKVKLNVDVANNNFLIDIYSRLNVSLSNELKITIVGHGATNSDQISSNDKESSISLDRISHELSLLFSKNCPFITVIFVACQSANGEGLNDSMLTNLTQFTDLTAKQKLLVIGSIQSVYSDDYGTSIHTKDFHEKYDFDLNMYRQHRQELNTILDKYIYTDKEVDRATILEKRIRFAKSNPQILKDTKPEYDDALNCCEEIIATCDDILAEVDKSQDLIIPKEDLEGLMEVLFDYIELLNACKITGFCINIEKPNLDNENNRTKYSVTQLIQNIKAKANQYSQRLNIKINNYPAKLARLERNYTNKKISMYMGKRTHIKYALKGYFNAGGLEMGRTIFDTLSFWSSGKYFSLKEDVPKLINAAKQLSTEITREEINKIRNRDATKTIREAIREAIQAKYHVLVENER